MKRDISGTSVATAILLIVAAMLLCIKLHGMDAHGLRLPPAVALPIEAAFYGGVIYLWCGRFNLWAQALGLVALFAIRILISTAGIAGAQLEAGHRPVLGAVILSPLWQSWMTAAAFAVVALHLVRNAVLPIKAPEARPVAGVSPAAKVAFDTLRAPSDPVGQAAEAAAATLEAEASTFRVLEPRPTAAKTTTAVALPEVEGWVTVPAAVVAEQLPGDAELDATELLIPYSVIFPKLREGEVRIRLSELDGVYLPLGAEDNEPSIELPLPLIVPQIPDEAFELPEAQPPAWLLADGELEDIFFAKV